LNHSCNCFGAASFIDIDRDRELIKPIPGTTAIFLTTNSNMMSRIIQSLVLATLIANIMSVEVKEALISDEGATSGVAEHHQYYGKTGKGSKGYAYYGGKGAKGGNGHGGGYGSGNGDSEPVHEPEASGDWEPEPEPVHHESDDYFVYGKACKGGKGSKGGYGGGELEPEHEPEVKGDWEPELEPVHHESDDYYVYGKSGKGGKGSKGGYGNGDGHYTEPEAEPELAGNSGSGDWF
jgi:hypothetical protein